MKSRAYRASAVNGIDVARILDGRTEGEVHAGLDVGKEFILCVIRWGRGDFERPWRVRNPHDVGCLAGLLREVARGRRLSIALERPGRMAMRCGKRSSRRVCR